jgi:hypothetical protein
MILNSPTISGSLTVTGNIIASGSITLSGSVASASYAATASFVALAQSASNAVSAATASFANAFTVASTLTAQTLVVQTITSSVDFVTGSTRFGTLSSNTHIFTGSLNVTGALYIATGSVGIGTVSPSQLFEVVGGEIKAGRVDLSNEGGQISFGRSTDNATAWYIDAYGNVASPQLRFVNVTNAVVAMTITGSNVGIGTSSPSYKLTVSQNTNGFYPLRLIGGDSLQSEMGFYLGNSGGSLGLNTSGDLSIFTNGADRMRITSGGNVGIGTTGFSDVRCAVTGVDSTSSNYVFICKNGGGTNLFNLRNDGYFQASGIYNFTSSGGTAVYCASDGGVYRFTSSERYKREITDYTKGLSKLLEIKPKWFKSINPKEGEKIFAGLIAEQIDEIGLNEFVEYNDESQPDAVHYSAMTALLVKAIQELKTQNDALQSRIETLESK